MTVARAGVAATAAGRARMDAVTPHVLRAGPDARRLRPFDLVLAAVTVVASAVGTAVEIAGADRPVPAPLPGIALAVVAGACAFARRRPGATAGVVAVCLAYHLAGYPGLAPAVALFVTVYAMVADGEGARSLLGAGAAIVAVSAIPLLPPVPAAAELAGPGWSIVGPAIGFVAVAALGEAARARRVALEERLRAAQQEARRRRMQDRVDMAREVHDVLAHTVAVIAVQAAAAAEAIDERPDEARAGLAVVRAAAREALTELRGTITVLREGSPDEPAGSGPGLDRLAELCGRAGLPVTLTVSGDRPLPPPVGRAVYRIVQEALTNTVRHAGASAASVVVDRTGPQVRVEVSDDGTGPVTPLPGAGHGLRGMRERAEALAGTLEAGPAPGGGFRVRALLPAGDRP